MRTLGWAVLLAGSLGLGCPKQAEEQSGGTCAKVGQTCKLSQGLLGVCTEAAPGSCDREPCLICMGQH
jgi:hypothetical protein